MMQKIISLLSKVYQQDELQFLEEEIEKLLLHYQNIRSERPFALSEKDVVLISYADAVFSTGENKLHTLNNTLTSYLKNDVSIVHLLPFFPYSSDDGFSVIDYYAVDSEIGDWQDVKALSRNFNLMFDAVVNHSSQQCEWFQKFLEDDPQYKAYYLEIDDPSAYANAVRPRTSPLSHRYGPPNNSKDVWTTFSEDQVDLNFRNPMVFLQILDVLLFYISKGAAIIRLDAIGFLWKEKFSTSIHLEQTHLIIKAYRKIIERLSPSTIILTETNVPHQENISYFGDGDEAHMVYNFTLPPLLAFSILSGTTSRFFAWAKNLEVPFSNVCFFNFLASHDGVGVRPVEQLLNEQEINNILEAALANGGKVSYKMNPDGNESPYEINCNYFSLLKGIDKSESLGVKRMILAHAVLLAMPGLPAIYLHSFFGSENDLEGMNQSGINRRINREKLSYGNLKMILKNSNSRQSFILNSLKLLIQARKKEAAFNPYSSYQFTQPAEGLIGIERHSENGKSNIFSIFNFGDKRATVSLKKSLSYRDMFDNKVYRGVVELSPLSFKWLKIGDQH